MVRVRVLECTSTYTYHGTHVRTRVHSSVLHTRTQCTTRHVYTYLRFSVLLLAGHAAAAAALAMLGVLLRWCAYGILAYPILLMAMIT
jgi:hypothetical protein